MTTQLKTDALKRRRLLAWLLVPVSVIALSWSQPGHPNLPLLLMAFFTLLGSLVAILVIGHRLRKLNTGQKESSLYGVLWPVAFLVFFGIFNVCFTAADWAHWVYFAYAVLSFSSAFLMWRQSRLAQYPIYAMTVFFIYQGIVGAYYYAQNREVLQSPIIPQIIGWSIPLILSALLINCCLRARRIV